MKNARFGTTRLYAWIFGGAVAVAATAFAAGWFLHKPLVQPRISVMRADTDFKLIHPLIAVDSAGSFVEYEPLKEKLQDIIQQAVSDRKVDNVSLYFRDMNNGHWVGLNENDTYYPASLFKVPVLIAYYKEAEEDPSILDKKLYFAGETADPESEYTEEPSGLVAGRSYTVKELIDAMIVRSDNFAKDLLLKNIDPNSFTSVLTDLGVQVPQTATYTISAKTYAYFFRTLYSATEIDREDSEAALELLGQVQFKDGLVAGTPNGLLVAHKYGERVSYDANGEKNGLEFHDCGIVYYPQTPYLLCVMTKGYDLANAESVVQDLSRAVYADVNTSK